MKTRCKRRVSQPSRRSQPPTKRRRARARPSAAFASARNRGSGERASDRQHSVALPDQRLPAGLPALRRRRERTLRRSPWPPPTRRTTAASTLRRRSGSISSISSAFRSRDRPRDAEHLARGRSAHAFYGSDPVTVDPSTKKGRETIEDIIQRRVGAATKLVDGGSATSSNTRRACDTTATRARSTSSTRRPWRRCGGRRAGCGRIGLPPKYCGRGPRGVGRGTMGGNCGNQISGAHATYAPHWLISTQVEKRCELGGDCRDHQRTVRCDAINFLPGHWSIWRE